MGRGGRFRRIEPGRASMRVGFEFLESEGTKRLAGDQ